MSDYSSQYASLINSQNDNLGNIASQNQADFIDSSNKILQDAKNKQDKIDKLHQSEQLGLLPEAIKDSDYTDTAVFGLKTTLDLGSNLKSVGKARREAKVARDGLRTTPFLENADDSEVFLLNPSSSASIASTASQDAAKVAAKTATVGTDQAGFGTKLYRTARDSSIGQKISQFGSDTVQGAKDIGQGLKTAENVGEALTKEVGESVSIAGKALEKLAPVADIASGGLNIGEDVDGLIKGKSLKEAMGDNSEERWSNALGIAGSALTFIPGADLVGGLLDITSGVLDFFGEKDEAEDKDAKANKKITDIQNQATPLMATPISTPGMASLGIISNYSKPQQTLIQGSGAF